MIKRNSKIVIVFIITLIISSQLSAEDKKDQLIDELYVKSEFDAQVKNFPDIIKLSIDQQTALIDKSEGITKEYFKNVNNLLYTIEPMLLASRCAPKLE